MFNDVFYSDNGLSVLTADICRPAALCVLGCSKYIINNFEDFKMNASKLRGKFRIGRLRTSTAEGNISAFIPRSYTAADVTAVKVC